MPEEIKPEVVVPVTLPPEVLKTLEEVKALSETQAAEIQEMRQGMEELKPKPEPLTPDNDPDNRPIGTFKELREEMKATASQMTKDELKRVEDERTKILNDEKTNREALDKQFDEAVDKAQTEGLISAVTNPNDPNDQGNQDRRELFAIAAKLGTANLFDVARQIKEMHDSGKRYDYQKDQFVAIAPQRTASGFTNTPPPTAPVGSSSQRVAAPNTGKPSYDTIHKARNLDDLLARYN